MQMISTAQDEVIESLTEIRTLSPDVPFGQLVAHMRFLVEHQADHSLREIDDAQILDVLKEHRAELLRRR